VVDDTEGAKLVLWDIDHTLIETRGVGGCLARAAFEQITGKQPEEMAEATGNTERVILAETLRTHDIEPTDAYQERYALALPEQYRQHIDALKQTGRAIPGAAEAVAALHRVPGIIQTVLTGNYRAVAAIKLTAFDLDDLLDLEVGAYADDGADRAALVPVAQQRAGEKYRRRFTRANTIVIGDTTHDVAAAHAGGADVIAVANGNHDLEQLRAAGADTVLEDLTDTAALVAAVTTKT
jgi:phosphoglycolate phosphatase-like HAD superfamily hydrolase